MRKLARAERMSSPRPEQLLVDQIPHLRRYARALLRDRDTAEDLLQDVLARAWSRLHLWRPGTNMRTWLFAIMHNLHAIFVRDRSRRPSPVALDPQLPRLSERARQADDLELAAVEAALAELPIDQRAVVLLIGLEGFSYQEAA
ncbi:MAG: sigma-70 family RNA polymerase sigma factor, partial [Alphaproteobacteria bacterium]|nr:sigma-70 family RNA polymerase sigma factor [Alphaproteobacteria bacterium]